MGDLLEKIKQEFQEIYPDSSTPRVFFAPGRVNLIGEHTDYTGGFVMPMALDLGITMLATPRDDGVYHLKSTNFENSVEFSNSYLLGNEVSLDKKDPWGNYPKGIVLELSKLGLELKGADILYSSNLPTGAGLSSSAAIGMVTAYGLSKLGDLQITNEELAFLCQRMENDFIGVKSGIMDQFAVGLSKKDHAIFLDCNSMEWEYVPLNLEGHKVVITNTGKKRGLNESRYNERRHESEEALQKLSELKPQIKSYRDLTLADLSLINTLMYPYKERARHIVTENHRVLEAKKALESGSLTQFGQLMLASHRSLSVDYEVTGRELDSLFQSQLEAGCFKTRMTGAGFGGCTVSLVIENKVEYFIETVRANYKARTGLDSEFYLAKSSGGVREIREGL
ncbi:MAG: galactokinase [Firmicutes bacterium]|nr:galactokinase [Bacillota bacterium]MDD4693703.1 galactokinase [Bacillota bacterium]